MTDLILVCLDFRECNLLPSIKSSISELLSSKIILRKDKIELEKYFNPERGQYNAGEILSEFDINNTTNLTILITSVDLYIPIFTYVFGLAKLNGSIAIVSSYRLRPEFYGLPPDDHLLKRRLIKEVIHELGHLLNLRHCSDFRCVMTSSNTADDLDIKGMQFCDSCLNRLNLG